jgi:hypothetical protein
LKLSKVVNHGRPRWRLNVQGGGYRRKLFFKSFEAADAFVRAVQKRPWGRTPLPPALPSRAA